MAGTEPRPALAPYIGVLVVAIGAPVYAAVSYGTGITQASVTGELIPPARLIPMDWLAGMFLGVPWGLGWVAGMVKEHATATAS